MYPGIAPYTASRWREIFFKSEDSRLLLFIRKKVVYIVTDTKEDWT